MQTNRIPNLGKLSIALLENFVKPAIGEKIIDEIKKPYAELETRVILAKCLLDTEKRFISEHNDKELCESLLDIPLADLPSVQKAIVTFYYRPTDSTLANVLRQNLARDFSRLTKNRIENAVTIYTKILREEITIVSPQIRELLNALALQKIEENTSRMAELMEIQTQVAPRPGSAPPLPSLIIGRDEAIRDLKTHLGIGSESQNATTVLTAVRGWPGVGKTTIASAIAHDPEITQKFPDGVLWVSLGTIPNPFDGLSAWGRALGTDDVLRAKTVEEASALLAGLLRHKRMLLIVDDVWESQHAIPFKVGGLGCAMLITTRITSVAQDLAPTPNNIYRLAELSEEKALELLQTLTPGVVAQHPEDSLQLVRELEGLPLAIQVAGHLLNVEVSYGFDVSQLLVELRDGARVIKAKAPADRTDLANETTPTVAALLQKSTERLDTLTRDCFAYLGAFAPKPATFDLNAMKAVWQIDDPKPIVRQLVDRGLLELVSGRFQMHALLVSHARTLLAE